MKKPYISKRVKRDFYRQQEQLIAHKGHVAEHSNTVVKNKRLLKRSNSTRVRNMQDLHRYKSSTLPNLAQLNKAAEIYETPIEELYTVEDDGDLSNYNLIRS